MAGPDLEDLMKFEKKKTEELNGYTRLCEGIKPDVKRLRTAVEAFQDSITKFDLGSAPFTFGEFKDYWPDITSKHLNAYNKTDYADWRSEPILSKLADQEKERQERLEEHITHLFQCEREATKVIIHSAVSELKESIGSSSGRMGGYGGYGGRHGGKSSNRNPGVSPPGQSYQSPFQNQHQTSSFGHQHGYSG